MSHPFCPRHLSHCQQWLRYTPSRTQLDLDHRGAELQFNFNPRTPHSCSLSFVRLFPSSTWAVVQRSESGKRRMALGGWSIQPLNVINIHVMSLGNYSRLSCGCKKKSSGRLFMSCSALNTRYSLGGDEHGRFVNTIQLDIWSLGNCCKSSAIDFSVPIDDLHVLCKHCSYILAIFRRLPLRNDVSLG